MLIAPEIIYGGVVGANTPTLLLFDKPEGVFYKKFEPNRQGLILYLFVFRAGKVIIRSELYGYIEYRISPSPLYWHEGFLLHSGRRIEFSAVTYAEELAETFE